MFSKQIYLIIFKSCMCKVSNQLELCFIWLTKFFFNFVSRSSSLVCTVFSHSHHFFELNVLMLRYTKIQVGISRSSSVLYKVFRQFVALQRRCLFALLFTVTVTVFLFFVHQIL